MDNRRLLLAIVLSWGAVVLWGLLFSPKAPETPPPGSAPPREAAQGAAPGDERSPTDPAPAGVETGAVGAGGVETAGVEATEESAAPELVEDTRERTERVETARFVAELSNRGGVVTSFLLRRHLNEADEPLDLVRRRTGGLYPFALVGAATEDLELNDALFRMEKREDRSGIVEVRFEHRGQRGTAEKVFRFLPNGLFEVEAKVAGRASWGLFLGPGVENPSVQELARPQFLRGMVYLVGGSQDTRDAAGTDEVEIFPGSAVRWIALEDVYFLAAAIPQGGVAQVEAVPFYRDPATVRETPPADPDEGAVLPATGVYRPLVSAQQLEGDAEDSLREIGLVVRAGGDQVVTSHYWGAKVYEDLAALPFGLEETVRFGWFTLIARPLHTLLRWIHDNVVANYGWAIVLMTLFIRLILLPLTHKAMSSSQKMQELNPKIQAINARYKGKLRDKQGRPNADANRKKQEEIMAIYKSAGVNPAMGCLPMLVQLPIFIAFYWLLGGAIELRHAPWELWIHDLSVADPTRALPLLMFGTQFVQQWRMPMGADPMQRKLFMFMPFIFLFFFLGFPAGMVLYWLTNNVVGIVQQEVYKELRKRRAAEGEAGDKEKGKDKDKEKGRDKAEPAPKAAKKKGA